MTHPFDQEEKVCNIHNQSKIIVKRQTESKAIIVTLECPECGNMMQELSNKFIAHWLYLRYVLIHKYYVFVAGLKYKVPIWNLIIHDWTKFLPIEWFPYIDNFYLNPPKRKKQPKGHFQTPTGTPFDYAWLHHQNYWPHHWQYFILVYDNEIEKMKILKMPEVYAREMCADWTGAGLAQGKPDILAWYTENKDKILIHPETRELVERLLNE